MSTSRARYNANLGAQAASGLDASDITTGTLGNTVQDAITRLGTVATGTWEGTTVAVAQGGTGVTSKTGTGNVVLSASPTFSGTVDIVAQKHWEDNSAYLAGSGFSSVYGTDWQDVLQADFTSVGSWGFLMLITAHQDYASSNHSGYNIHEVAGHAAVTSFDSPTVTHLGTTTTGKYQWVNGSTGIIKLQMKNAYSSEGSSISFEWTTCSRANQPIVVTYL